MDNILVILLLALAILFLGKRALKSFGGFSKTSGKCGNCGCHGEKTVKKIN